MGIIFLINIMLMGIKFGKLIGIKYGNSHKFNGH